MGANIHQTMVTATVMTGTEDDLKPDHQMPIALLATNEDYDNISKAFEFISPEVTDVRENGFQYVAPDLPRLMD